MLEFVTHLSMTAFVPCMTHDRVRDTSVYDRVRAMYDMEEFVTHLSYVNTHETGASFEAV